MDQSCLC